MCGPPPASSNAGRTVSLETSGGNLRRTRTADFYVGHAAVGPTNLVHRASYVALIRGAVTQCVALSSEAQAGCARVAGVIEASAPVRICDNGGWTDTWFGGPGGVVEYRREPGGRGLDSCDTGAPGPVVFDVEDLRRAGTRSSRAPFRDNVRPAAGGRDRRVPTARGPRGGSQRPFRGSGWLRRGYVRGGSGRAPWRVGGDALRAMVAARRRLRSPSTRGRRPRRRERDPGSAPAWRSAGSTTSKSNGNPEATVQTLPEVGGNSGPWAHADLPWPCPRLLERAPSGDRRSPVAVAGVRPASRRGGRGAVTLSWLRISTPSVRR